jgi:hypothetical protein
MPVTTLSLCFAVSLTLTDGPVEAPVTEAIVYSDRARVTRTATVDVRERLRVEFAPLPPGVEATSVRVDASGGAAVETVEIRAVGQEGLPAAEAAELLAAIERADDAIAQLERERALYTQLSGVTDWRPALDGVDSDDGDVPAGGPPGRRPRLDPRGWQAGMAFLTGFAASMQARLREAGDVLDDRRRARQELAARARAMALPGARTLRVVAMLAGRGATTLKLRYEVPGARWTPRYEVRLQAAEGQVSVTLAAAVSQTTGEDWRDARLVLSTAVPFVASGPPRLDAWRIGDGERFIPTPRAATTVAAGGMPASLLPPLAPPSEEARLRRLLLQTANEHEATPDSEAAPAVARTEEGGIARVAPVVASAGARPDTGPGQMACYVFDQTGAPLAGVKLTLAGEAGGHLVAYSNPEGFTRFTGLGPGRYQVTASAPKLRAVVQRGIVVGDGPGPEVSLVMEVDSATEAVMVHEQAPTVSTSSANVSESFDVHFIDGLPSAGRDVVHTQLAGHGAGEPRPPVSLAPPPGYRRVRLAADAPAVLAGGRDLSFPAPRPETLLSGAGERRVQLASWRWPVAVERTVYPALADRAFLVATLASPLADVLPAGPAQLYVGADAVGTARLNLVAPGERFQLPLGEDLDVRPVRRVTVETHQRGLIWKRAVSRYTVTIELVNPHQAPVRVRVRDQIPVSPDRTVKVRLESSSPAATVDAHTGEVAWSLDLRPGGAATVRLVYTLARPRGHRLHQ